MAGHLRDDGGTYDEMTVGRKPMHSLEYCTNKEPRNRSQRDRLGTVLELPYCTG